MDDSQQEKDKLSHDRLILQTCSRRLYYILIPDGIFQ